jgi:hypothetical protein
VHPAVVRPLLFPNRPAPQSVHVPWPPTLYFPGTQIDAVADVDPATHACPAGHIPVHPAVVRPLLFPNRPTAQSVHVPWPPRLYFPGTQIDAVADVDPATHACPTLQFPLHVDTDPPGVAPN